MKRILTAVLILSTLNSFAQKGAKPDAYAKTISPQDLRKHLYIVAGPEMEGRETATEGQRRAAAYIESQFRALGLQPGNNGSYQLYYDVYQDSLTDASLEVNGTPFQQDKDFNAIASNMDATMKFSEVMVVGSASSDSLKNVNLAGRLVMVVGASAPMGGRVPANSIFSTLLSKGVAAILVVNNSFPRTTPASRKAGQSTSAFRRSITPQQFLISENVARAIVGADYDVAKGASSVRTYTANVLLDVKKTTVTAQSSNVIAVLPETTLKDQ